MKKSSAFYLILAAAGLLLITSCRSRAVKGIDNGTNSIPDYQYGFINKSGEQVIVAKFSDAKRFSEGLAAVSTGSIESRKWGYIDKSGKWIIPAQFDDAFQFHDGLAIVKSEGLYGYINTTGQYAIQPQFTEARPFYGNIDAAPKFSEEYGYKVWSKVPGENPYSGTLAAVQVGTLGRDKNIKNKWGYIDRAGNLKIEAEFCFAGTYYEDLALVKVPESNGKCATAGGRWGYIDRNGEFAIQPTFEQGGNFHEGLTWVTPIINEQLQGSSENPEGYIDKSGSFVIPPIFTRASDFSEGLAAAATSEKRLDPKWGYIDKSGSFVISPIYRAASRFHDGFSIVETLDVNNYRKPIYINKKGESIFAGGSVGQADTGGNFFEDIARVNVSALKCSYINISGELITTAQFNACSDFREGVAGVLTTQGENSSLDKFNYIDKTGKNIIDLELGSSGGDFSEGLAAIRILQ
jgi:hypothetical protein